MESHVEAFAYKNYRRPELARGPGKIAPRLANRTKAQRPHSPVLAERPHNIVLGVTCKNKNLRDELGWQS